MGYAPHWSPWLVLAVMALGSVAYVVRRLVDSTLQLRRERSALANASHVYEAGGDAAAVLRAVGGEATGSTSDRADPRH
jgi:hypothetical protein